MKFSQSIGSVLGSALKALPSSLGIQLIHGLRSSLGDVKTWLSGSLSDEADGRVDAPYRQHGTTALAVDILSSDAASVGWELFKTKDGKATDEEIEAHPVFDLWRMPNGFMSGDQLFIGTYILDLLFGEAFWYYPEVTLPASGSALDRLASNSGELVLLDPRSVKHRVSGNELRWSLERTGLSSLELKPERLTHFKRFNPYDPVRGLPKILAIIADIEGDVAAAAYNRNFFSSQNGVPTGLIIPGAPATGLGGSLPLTPAQSSEFLRSFSSKHGRRRAVGMLPAGWTWHDLGLSQRDMDYRGLREYSREGALALWGVPPFLAGVLDKANYANAREQKQVYWQGTITRFLKRYASTINFDFFPKLGIDGLLISPRWSTVNALVENLKAKSEVAEIWHRMGLPKKVINERLKMGWDPDDIVDYEDGYLPLNLVPTGSIGDAFAPPALPPALPPAGESNGDEKAYQLAGKSPLILLSDAREIRRAAIWKNIVVRTRDIELGFERVLRSHLKNLEEEALLSIASLKGWIARSTKASEGMVIFDIADANRTLVRRTRPHHVAAVTRGGGSVIADLGIAISFNVADPLVVSILATLSHKIKGINVTVEAALRVSLAEGLALSETLDQLRDRVRGVMRVSLGRARTIGRTETGIAFNGGRNLSMRQAGITKHEWLSSRDPDVRDSHTAEDTNIVNIGEPFPVTGLLYPQSPDGLPGEVINCRCVSVPVVKA